MRPQAFEKAWPKLLDSPYSTALSALKHGGLLKAFSLLSLLL
jgi:hypothetical protein